MKFQEPYFWECSNTYCSDSDLLSNNFGVFHRCHYAKAREFGILCQCSQPVRLLVLLAVQLQQSFSVLCFFEEPCWVFSPRCFSINKASDCNVDAPEIQQTNQPPDSPEIYGGVLYGWVH